MIEFKYGDILTTGAQVICHQVNCKGVMGKGLAKQIRDKYPDLYIYYKRFIDTYTIDKLPLLGEIFVYFTEDAKHFIVNIFAQDSYGYNKVHTDLNALKKGLEEVITLSNISIQNGMKPMTIAVPYNIGAGLGGANPDDVHALLNEVFKDYEGTVEFWIYEC